MTVLKRYVWQAVYKTVISRSVFRIVLGTVNYIVSIAL